MSDRAPMLVNAKVLTPRRRQIVYLRAAGYTYDQIGEITGLTTRSIQRHMQIVNSEIVPGLTDCHGNAKGFRLAYVLGLIDMGADADDVVRMLKNLPKRAHAVQTGKGPGRQEATGLLR